MINLVNNTKGKKSKDHDDIDMCLVIIVDEINCIFADGTILFRRQPLTSL